MQHDSSYVAFAARKRLFDLLCLLRFLSALFCSSVTMQWSARAEAQSRGGVEIKQRVKKLREIQPIPGALFKPRAPSWPWFVERSSIWSRMSQKLWRWWVFATMMVWWQWWAPEALSQSLQATMKPPNDTQHSVVTYWYRLPPAVHEICLLWRGRRKDPRRRAEGRKHLNQPRNKSILTQSLFRPTTTS